MFLGDRRRFGIAITIHCKPQGQKDVLATMQEGLRYHCHEFSGQGIGAY